LDAEPPPAYPPPAATPYPPPAQPAYPQQPPQYAAPGQPPQYAAPYPPQYGYPQQFTPSRGTSGLAIAALILGIIGLFPLGWLFGFLALRSIKKSGEKGRGMAIAGIVLGTLWAVLTGVIVGVAISQHAERDSSGAIVDDGQIRPQSLRVGDCFEGGDDTGTVRLVHVVPCTKPHDREVFATTKLTGDDYPGDKITEVTQAACMKEIEKLPKKVQQNSDLQLYFLYPAKISWEADDKRAVCIAGTTAQTTGSVRD
jgi:hypothetical protein